MIKHESQINLNTDVTCVYFYLVKSPDNVIGKIAN